MGIRNNTTMGNFSNSTKISFCSSPPQLTFYRFLILESIVSGLSVIVAYLIIGFVVYECKKQRWRSKSGRDNLRNCLKQIKKIPKFVLVMRTELLLALLFLLGRMVCEHSELLMQYLDVGFDYCDFINKVKMILTTVNVAAVYLFLWTRQRFYYSEPAMKELSNKATRVISSLSLFFLFLGHFVGSILFLLFRDFNMSLIGCVNDISDDTLFEFLPWIWVATGSCVFQIILFVLFIYPLIRHKSLAPSSNGFHDSLPLIKRMTIVTSVCIATDVISSLLIILARDSNEILPTILYDLSAVANVLCLIMSFGDWKIQLLAPFRVCNKLSWGSVSDPAV